MSTRDTSLSQLESRLQTAQKDKSSLQAKVAALEKEISNLKTSNEKLKSKVTHLHEKYTFLGLILIILKLTFKLIVQIYFLKPSEHFLLIKKKLMKDSFN